MSRLKSLKKGSASGGSAPPTVAPTDVALVSITGNFTYRLKLSGVKGMSAQQIKQRAEAELKKSIHAKMQFSDMIFEVGM